MENSMRKLPSVEEVSKVLGEPVGFDISEIASKLRRNLLLVSIVVITLIVGEIKPGADFSVFGITLTGVTPFKLMIGLAVVLAYHFVHFSWYCYELYSEWSIRITGTRLSFVTGGKFASEGADYPDNPKQSTLYTWWLQEARSMSAYTQLLDQVESGVKRFDGHIEALQKADMTAAGSISQSIQEMKTALAHVRQGFSDSEKVISDSRIPASLNRFDNRFRLLLRSQNLRVLIVEVGVPLTLSAVAGVFLFRFFLSVG